MRLNTDFGMAGMSSQDLQAVVAVWQSGAISRDTMFELFRSGEILPDGGRMRMRRYSFQQKVTKGTKVLP